MLQSKFFRSRTEMESVVRNLDSSAEVDAALRNLSVWCRYGVCNKEISIVVQKLIFQIKKCMFQC